jgi:hypothetical protein
MKTTSLKFSGKIFSEYGIAWLIALLRLCPRARCPRTVKEAILSFFPQVPRGPDRGPRHLIRMKARLATALKNQKASVAFFYELMKAYPVVFQLKIGGECPIARGRHGRRRDSWCQRGPFG